MKNITYISLILTALIFSACSKNEPPSITPVVSEPEIETQTVDVKINSLNTLQSTSSEADEADEADKADKTKASDADEFDFSDMLNSISGPEPKPEPEEISLESLGLI